MIAAESGSFDTVQILVQNNARIDISDAQNLNAASLAQVNGHNGVAEFLSAANAPDKRQSIKSEKNSNTGKDQPVFDQFMTDSDSDREEFSFTDPEPLVRKEFTVPKPRAAPPSKQLGTPPTQRSSNVDTGSWSSDDSEIEPVVEPGKTNKLGEQRISFAGLMKNFSSDESDSKSINEPEVNLGTGNKIEIASEEESDWTESAQPVQIVTNSKPAMAQEELPIILYYIRIGNVYDLFSIIVSYYQ
jgi:hypothetical protein